MKAGPPRTRKGGHGRPQGRRPATSNRSRTGITVELESAASGCSRVARCARPGSVRYAVARGDVATLRRRLPLGSRVPTSRSGQPARRWCRRRSCRQQRFAVLLERPLDSPRQALGLRLHRCFYNRRGPNANETSRGALERCSRRNGCIPQERSGSAGRMDTTPSLSTERT